MASNSIRLKIKTPKARIWAAMCLVRLWIVAARLGLPVPRESDVDWISEWVARGVRVDVA